MTLTLILKHFVVCKERKKKKMERGDLEMSQLHLRPGNGTAVTLVANVFAGDASKAGKEKDILIRSPS